MKLLRSKRQGTLRGMIVRRSSDAAADARTARPTSALVALAAQQEQGKRRTIDVQAPLPSDESFVRQFLRVWTRRLMLLCAVGAICLAAAVPLLSMVKVKQIDVSGYAHYDAKTLADGTGVAVGDELLSCSPGAIQAALLQGYPYLASVSVDRALSGKISIVVTERTPLWALAVSEDQVALLDDTMWVLEICPKNTMSDALCLVEFELFPPTEESEGEEQENEQEDEPPKEVTVGQTYDGNKPAIAKLNAIAEAMRGVALFDGVEHIDMSDPYAVTVTLSDGTVLLLHEALKPEEQLRAAKSAMEAYRAQSGDIGPLRVDVDDFSRVNIRPAS